MRELDRASREDFFTRRYRMGMSLVLGGRYRLDTLIGGGGMGEMWRAHDDVLDRVVAVKLIRAHLADDENVRARLRVEARLAGSLHHPGIADVFDYGEDEIDGRTVPFLVMRLVDGASLREVLRVRRTLTSGETMAIVAEVAGALWTAHQAGIVHRDLKPANILLTRSGRVMLVDFGIARSIDGEALTQTGSVIGTADYLSPEQSAGRSANHLSDLYALGVVAYACLVGTPPFRRESDIATALAHIQAPVPELPEEVRASGVGPLIEALLAKDPSERPKSAAVVEASSRPLATDVPTPDGVTTSVYLAQTKAETSVTPRSTGVIPVEAALGVDTMPFAPAGPAPTREASEVDAENAARGRRRPRRGVVLGAAAAVALFAIVLGLIFAGGADQVLVPSLRGMNSTEAAVALTNAGLVIKPRRVDAVGHKKGEVLTQSPATGTKVDKMSVVKVTVATGYVAVPKDLVGSTYGKVAAALTTLGLKPSRTYTISTKPAGTVLEMSPQTRAMPGDTIVVKVATAPQPAPTGGKGKHGNGKHGKGKRH